MEIPLECLVELDEVMAVCGFETKKEFFNTAINLLKWAMQQAQEGREIASIDNVTEDRRELKAPFLEYIWDHSAARDRDDS